MENSFKIRKAKIDDLNAILRLNSELFKIDYEFDKTLVLKWPFSKFGKNFFKDSITDTEKFCQVVEDRGKVIGYLLGGLTKRSSAYKKYRYAVLTNIIVAEKYRGKNIGRKVLQEYKNWCKKKKIDYLDVVAFSGNRKAIEFYRKNGFKDYTLKLRIKI